MGERLQKILSQAGICSRRRAEEYLLAGRVTVNGKRAELGDKADPLLDEITLDGIPIRRKEERVYLMLNKPRGVVTTLSDEKGRRNVLDLISGLPARVWPVGRLDMDSEGLLLLCNDGELTQRLTHPSYKVEKEYHVWVRGALRPAIECLRQPMQLDGEWVGPARVSLLEDRPQGALLSIVIHEGKNRQVRRMCAQAGLTVRRLKRVREGELYLDEQLAPGQWRYLSGPEIERLRAEHTV